MRLVKEKAANAEKKKKLLGCFLNPNVGFILSGTEVGSKHGLVGLEKEIKEP